MSDPEPRLCHRCKVNEADECFTVCGPCWDAIHPPAVPMRLLRLNDGTLWTEPVDHKIMQTAYRRPADLKTDEILQIAAAADAYHRLMMSPGTEESIRKIRMLRRALRRDARAPVAETGDLDG